VGDAVSVTAGVNTARKLLRNNLKQADLRGMVRARSVGLGGSALRQVD
jgi:hypothetical protein